MANQVEPKLIAPLLEKMKTMRFATISTVDFETGAPAVNAISWLIAKSEAKLAFVIDNRSRIVENIRNNENVVINVIINESSYSISGKAKVKEEKLSGIPLKLALLEMDITEVRDVMFYGAKINSNPQYEYTYDEKAATKLNKQVEEALLRS